MGADRGSLLAAKAYRQKPLSNTLSCDELVLIKASREWKKALAGELQQTKTTTCNIKIAYYLIAVNSVEAIHVKLTSDAAKEVEGDNTVLFMIFGCHFCVNRLV